MPYTEAAFAKSCLDAAKCFLQTVVVIDNEAQFEMDEAHKKYGPKTVTTPIAKTIRTTSKPDDLPSPALLKSDKAPEATTKAAHKPVKDRRLHAKPIIDKFADDGIVCSVIKPETTDNGAEVEKRCIAVAKAADIVVIDWELGKGETEVDNTRSNNIIRGILEADIAARGRLRLIAVYTAETVSVDLATLLFNYIKDLDFHFGNPVFDKQKICITNKHLKIIFVNKPGYAEHDPSQPIIDFDELPEKVIKEFSDLNRGLLPAVTMHSIAAIRKETHHLLAVLHSGLDGTLVGHRCLLPHPEDEEDFCLDLIAGELRAVLTNSEIGARHAGLAAHKRWIDANHQKKFTSGKFRLTKDQAFLLAETGQKDHATVLSKIMIDSLEQYPNGKDIGGKKIDLEAAKRDICDSCKSAAKKYKVDITEKDIPNFFYTSKKAGQEANFEFSRLCTLKREAYGIRRPVADWRPLLTLGSILRCMRAAKGETFYLCLQPKCDSVRLKKDDNYGFPFLPLKKANDHFQFIVLLHDETGNGTTEKKLKFEAKPRNMSMFRFECNDDHAIYAAHVNGIHVFTDIYNNRFEWIADVKDMIAQKIAVDLSAQAGRVGPDEYDWLRRKAK